MLSVVVKVPVLVPVPVIVLVPVIVVVPLGYKKVGVYSHTRQPKSV